MKLNKWDKLAIAAVAIIVISVITGFIIKLAKIKFAQSSPLNIQKFQSELVLTLNLPESVISTAKKYGAFEEVFDKNNLVFLYGYNTLSFSKIHGKDFHREMKSLLKNEDLNYRVIPLKNPKDRIRQIMLDNGINPKMCLMSSKKTEKLNDLFEVIDDCSKMACIVDSANGKYFLITRNDPKYVIDVLKKYNPNKI